MKRLFVLILALLLTCSICACSFEPETFIVSHISPDSNYTVSLYQVGSPQWSFGPVKAKLILSNAAGKTIDEVSMSLANDGTDVGAANIVEIIWLENQVEVHMREFDTTKEYTYTLNFSE